MKYAPLYILLRHALFDLWLLDKSAEFDNREALLAELDRDGTSPSEDEQVQHVQKMLGTFRFLFRSVSYDVIACMVFDKIRNEVQKASDADATDLSGIDELALTLRVDGESLDEPVEITSDCDLSDEGLNLDPA